jgi:hypothetical protein
MNNIIVKNLQSSKIFQKKTSKHMLVGIEKNSKFLEY